MNKMRDPLLAEASKKDIRLSYIFHQQMRKGSNLVSDITINSRVYTIDTPIVDYAQKAGSYPFPDTSICT